MNVLRAFVLLFVFAATASFAGETNTPALSNVKSNALPTTITIDGVTYKNVRWVTNTAYAATIQHQTGVAVIPLASLPSDLRTRFNYNLAKSDAEHRAQVIADAQARRLRAEKAAQRAAAEAEREEQASRCDAVFGGKVLQVLDDGFLVSFTVRYYNDARDAFPLETGDFTAFVTPRFKDLTDGEFVKINARREGIYEYINVQGAKATVQKWHACSLSGFQ